MPFDSGLLIAVKDGVVELTATLHEPHREAPQAFAEALRQVLFDHQYQAMSDATILDPPTLDLASVVVSREPIPDGLRDALLSFGFVPLETEAGGRDRSVFSRFQRARRSKLDKWRSPYLRAAGVSEALGAFEACLVDDLPDGDLPDVWEAASRATIDAARTAFRLLLTPGLESLGELERRIERERSGTKGRWVLHPLAVRGLAAFAAQTFRALAPNTGFSEDPDDETPLHVVGNDGAVVRTDPEFRVIKMVIRGKYELLTPYVESVLTQSAESR